MSCPDWRALAAHRDAPRTAEPALWREAVAHLDRCGACREQAYAADPTLIFRRLPALDLDAGAEAEAMRQSVAVLRSGRRAEAGRRGAPGRWRRWVAAAVFALAMLSLGRGVPGPEDLGAMPSPPAFTSYRPATGSAPVIEGLDRPDARVYQVDGGGMSLVVVIDESLDV